MRLRFSSLLRDHVTGLALTVLLASCGGGVGGSASFTVSAAVSGLLAGKSLVLLNNGANSTPVSANGTIAFSTPISSGGSYAVTVATQPTGETCSVSLGSGTVGHSNITVAVACTANAYTIGGMISGLFNNGSAVLQNNGVDHVTLNGNGAFTFGSTVASGSTYTVTVSTQPAGESCTVTGGNGTVGGANVTDVSVNCTSLPFRLSVGVRGIATTTGLVLQNNGRDNLTIPTSGVYTFNTMVSSGSSYAVTVLAQPPGHTCIVMGGAGTVTSSDTSVTVICPWHVAYATGVPNSNAVYGIYIDEATGFLEPFGSGPFASGSSPGFIAISPDGRFAYVLTGDNTVWVYAIDSTSGALSPVATSPVAVGASPMEITVNPAGTAVYVPDSSSNSVFGFSVNQSTGQLSPIPGSPFVTGGDPLSIAINPAGTFAYVAANGATQIDAYSVDGTTGALTPIAGSPFSGGFALPGLFTVDPTGRFLYESGDGGGIYAFSIAASTGALTPIGGSPFPSADNVVGMSLDPNGRFLYTVTSILQTLHTEVNSVFGYAIDASTGALTQVSATQVSNYGAGVVVGPIGGCLDPSGRYLFVLNSLASVTIDPTTGAFSGLFSGWSAVVPAGGIRYMAITSLP